MTLQKLASLIAFKEGKKSQVKIGDIREMLKVSFDILFETPLPQLAKLWEKEIAKRQEKVLVKKRKSK